MIDVNSVNNVTEKYCRKMLLTPGEIDNCVAATGHRDFYISTDFSFL